MKKSIVRGACLVALTFFSIEASAEETATREQTAVDSALKRGVAGVQLAAPVATPETVVPGRASGGPIEAKSSGLGVVAGVTKAQSSAGAGSPNALAAPQQPTTVAVRPAARPQRGRRGAAKVEDPQRAVLDAMNATFASCLTSSDANVEGVAVLNAAIAPSGDVASVATVTPGGVSPKAVACFREVLSHAKFVPVSEPTVVQARVAPRELRATPAPTVAQN